MAKGGAKQTQTTTSAPDAASAQQLALMRQMASQGANVALQNPGSFFTGPLTQTPGQMAEGFFNPYQTQVVDATRREFDHLRNQALMGSNQQATQANAFGGSRAAVMAGSRMGELDRAQGSTIANLLSGGYQNALSQGVGLAQYNQGLQQQQQMEPLWRQQQALQMMNLGMGPIGTQTTQTGMQQGGKNPFGSALGGATAGASFGPWGAAIGGGLGLLSGMLG